MRVLYFHQHFCTPRGGGGIRSYAMARELLSRGHRVTMVCGSNARGGPGLTGPFRRGIRRGQVDGIDVVEIDLAYSNAHGYARRALTFARFALRSIAIALVEKYDLVFATSTPLTAGIPGVFARWLRRKPFVFEVRDLWPELPREMGIIKNRYVLAAMSALEYVSYHSATRLVGLSPGIAAGIERRGINPGRIRMIPNGCDLEIFGGDDSPWRPDEISDEKLLAVFAGAHGPANGLGAVLDAARVLKQRGRDDIALLLIGDGVDKPALQQRAAAEGLQNVFFHDLVPKAKLARLMSATDIGMQILANVPAFYYGTSPNKFFDYLAAGLPVLNNYPGWLANLLRDSSCGFPVPPDDPPAFADALISAADDRPRLKAMGQRALLLARGQFDRSMLAAQFVDWLEIASDARQDPPK